MLNFSNLNDVEFEYLCKDVMSKKLGVELERFGNGKDGGVDLTDHAYMKNIIVQVKHYIKTDVSGLISALKKEVPKVEKWKPETYYICCSKELTVQNKSEIYELFAKYMGSTANIITLIEINDFLNKEENADILHRHFKLWIESTNILKDTFTNDIWIDSEVLLNDIKENIKIFVETGLYKQARLMVEKNNALIIVGDPGTGKTITSKMLVLHYASLGYRVRYTTDGADLAGLKKSLSQSREVKEIILLDDCFGQAYFTMKQGQENELIALIKYVNMNQNKILIMNSRVTIYHEANDRNPELVKSLDKKEYRIYILDMSRISNIEKAKMLYTHFYFGDIPPEYREEIKKGKRYLEIVKHKNYSPRIIEFISGKSQYEKIEPQKYYEFIMGCLKNPEQIWKNEYERRLKTEDRILLTTLYSLTNTHISLEIVKKCYNYRIAKIPGIDISINCFENTLSRLKDAMVKIASVNGKPMLEVVNPSVNDFIGAQLENNGLEKDSLIQSIISVKQIDRLLIGEEKIAFIKRIFENGKILDYVFEYANQRVKYITCYCAKNKILDMRYQPYILEAVKSLASEREVQENVDNNIYQEWFDEDFCFYYGVDKILHNLDKLNQIYELLEMEELVKFIRKIDYLFRKERREDYIKISKHAVQKKIEYLSAGVSADEYDIDVKKIVEMFGDEGYWYSEYIDEERVISAIEEATLEAFMDEVYQNLEKLPEDIRISQEVLKSMSIEIIGARECMETVLLDYGYEDMDDYYENYNESEAGEREIEYIFER